MTKGKVPTRIRRKAVLDIMNKGITSPTEIVRVLALEYGIETTRQTVHRDIADGVQPITEDVIEDHKSSMLDNLDALLKVCHAKASRGDSNAMKTYAQLVKCRTEVLQKVVEIQREMNRAERPIYNIKIGDFPTVEKKKKDKEIKEDE